METQKLKKINVYTKINENEYLSSVQEFNEDGQLKSGKEFDSENNLSLIIEVFFDKNNMPVKEISDHVSDGFKETKTMKYDEIGTLISEKTEYLGGAYSVKKYIRNPEEKSLDIITFDEDGEVEESQKLFFNDKNKLINRSDYDEKGKLIEKTLFIYDDDNENLIRREEYNRKSKLEKIHFYIYDNSGLLTSIITENRKGKLLDWVKFEYNSDQKLVLQKNMSGTMIKIDFEDDYRTKKEEHYNQAGSKINEIITQTDAEGRVLSEASLGKEMTYKYEWY